MSVAAVALVPVLTDAGTGTGASTRTLNDELLDRAARDDYPQWLGTAMGAGAVSARSGCAAPSAASTAPRAGACGQTPARDDAAGRRRPASRSR
jgi:hypothetical protein